MVEYTQIGGAGGLGFDVLAARPFGPKVPASTPASSAYQQIGGAGGLGVGALAPGYFGKPPTSTFTQTPMGNVPVAQYSHVPRQIDWTGQSTTGLPSTIIPDPSRGRALITEGNEVLEEKNVLQYNYNRGAVSQSDYDTRMKDYNAREAVINAEYNDWAKQQADLSRSSYRTQQMQAEVISAFGEPTWEKTSFRVFKDGMWQGLPEAYMTGQGGDPYADAYSRPFQEYSAVRAMQDYQERVAHAEKISAEDSNGEQPAQATGAQPDAFDWSQFWASLKPPTAPIVDTPPPEGEERPSIMEQLKPYLTARNVAIVLAVVAGVMIIGSAVGGSSGTTIPTAS